MKLAVISTQESDLLHLLSQYAEVTRIDPDDAAAMAGYDAYALLGGCEDTPLLLPIDTRLVIEKERRKGTPVFAEYCAGIGYAFSLGSVPTVSDRLVYVGNDIPGLSKGDLLDDRANDCLSYFGFSADAVPLLVLGGHMIAHDHLDDLSCCKEGKYALWLEDAHTLCCAFRLCNYAKARFAPQKRWDLIAGLIIHFLTGKQADVHTEPALSTSNPVLSPMQTFQKGMSWFDGAEIFIKEGKDGVLEGLKHQILPDGTQLYRRDVRNDCSGEVSGACFFDWYLNRNEASYQHFRNLQVFNFEKIYENEPPHRGMMRWTTTEWSVCYSDDVARAIMGTLLCMQLTEDRKYLDKICGALDYLLQTTGTDGLRIRRTELYNLTPEKIARLHSEPSQFPCAHHNAHYMAVLLMAYGITGKQEYLDTARRGIESMMAVFPNTIREHSETQELCRLILPLACLLEATGEEKHREYLYRVVDRLEDFRSPWGGYREHDTGYQALRSRTSGTESSLLAYNGDPVADLLYSVNWLPLGFAYCYKVTKDERFITLWKDLATFLSEIQVSSPNPQLNGCWFRGIDLERREAYGMPHDVDWGPCCVESGWTVGEILMGLGLGMALGMDKQA